jgi:hypothetical protein
MAADAHRENRGSEGDRRGNDEEHDGDTQFMDFICTVRLSYNQWFIYLFLINMRISRP